MVIIITAPPVIKTNEHQIFEAHVRSHALRTARTLLCKCCGVFAVASDILGAVLSNIWYSMCCSCLPLQRAEPTC